MTDARALNTQYKHTPGPWHYSYDDKHGQAVVSGDHTEVATCWHHSVGSLEKQMFANARLIAAAPELLALLVEAADFVQPFNRAESLLDRIESAIAKATQP